MCLNIFIRTMKMFNQRLYILDVSTQTMRKTEPNRV